MSVANAQEDYRDRNPDRYAYSRFCDLYQRSRRKLDVARWWSTTGG